jgi:hypothetical protein
MFWRACIQNWASKLGIEPLGWASEPFGHEPVTMPRKRSPHPADFRQQMVHLVRSIHSLGELARKFQPWAACAQTEQTF